MLFKTGVNLTGVQEPTWYAIGVFEAIYKAHGSQLVVTSLTDGVHPDLINIHGRGFAADLRTATVPQTTQDIIVSEANAILRPLGYEVVHEVDHIHVQYKPLDATTKWQVEHS